MLVSAHPPSTWTDVNISVEMAHAGLEPSGYIAQAGLDLMAVFLPQVLSDVIAGMNHYPFLDVCC